MDNNLPSWLTAIATFFAAMAAFLGWSTQRSFSKREARKIVLDIYEKFFTREECRNISREIEIQRVKGEYKRFWKMLIENPCRDELDETNLDEYLGYFELLGSLVHHKVVFFEDVYDLFSYYVEVAWSHPEIRGYVEDIRKESNDPDTYMYFQYLAGLVTARSVQRRYQEDIKMPGFVSKVAVVTSSLIFGGLAGWGLVGIAQAGNHAHAISGLAAGAGLAGLPAIFFCAYWWQRESEMNLILKNCKRD
jgi:hypothetical protein